MASIYDDLNRSLFLQLDKLQDCDPEDIEHEIERSKQVANLAGQVIANQNAALALVRFEASQGMTQQAIRSIMPRAIGEGSAN